MRSAGTPTGGRRRSDRLGGVTSASAPLFAFEDVTVPGVARPRLDGVRAEVAGAGITAISGPSGAGKSTLLRLCNRLVAPAAGVVRYRGEDLARRDALAHRREVAMVFQQPVLFPGTVADNVRVAAPDADDDAIAALLERAALDASFAGRSADELSGGEAQRTCLARALATRPRVLLADEPASALDAANAHQLEQLLRDLDVPVLLVTHDDAQRDRLADAVLELREGRVVRSGADPGRRPDDAGAAGGDGRG